MAKRRVRDRARRAAQTAEQRQACLQRRRDRLNVESTEEREARLQQMRDRLAAESAGEREARLQRMRSNQSERLAAESIEEREDRRQRVNERETHANREEPFKQCSVQMKMRKFHEYFVTLNSPKCSTCSESFPGIQLRSPSTIRCYRDKHTPKLYSSANGMDPGPLPSQLQVSIINNHSTFYYYYYYYYYYYN